MEILADVNGMTSSDFSAIAVIDPVRNQFYWQGAFGSINNKHKKLRKKSGVGLIGLVFRHGRMIIMDDTVPDIMEKRLRSPIMLAENLLAAVAAPVYMNHSVIAVLLVGSRAKRIYSLDEIDRVVEAAEKMAAFFEQKEI